MSKHSFTLEYNDHNGRRRKRTMQASAYDAKILDFMHEAPGWESSNPVDIAADMEAAGILRGTIEANLPRISRLQKKLKKFQDTE